jgi:glycosyltransferase involved in cell wall biosynthesis
MKVSVIIPVFNAASFLDKCIQSALDQNQTGEVILIDDRSTDDSLEICKRWEILDRRVKVLINEGIKGAGAARNIGLRQAASEYIAFLDADDYFLDGRFDEDEIIYKKFPNIDGIARSIIKKYDSQSIINGYPIDESLISVESFIKLGGFSLIATTIKEDNFINIEYFDETLKQGQDTDWLFRLLIKKNIISGKFKNPASFCRSHENNTTNNIKEKNINLELLNKKMFFFFLQNKPSVFLLGYTFKSFMEYNYLNNFSHIRINKKILKLTLLPFFIFNILLFGFKHTKVFK